MTTPAHTDLLGDTDLAIRRVAEAADMQLKGSVRFSVLNPAAYTTNDYGDVLIRFPGWTVPMSGCYVYESTRGTFKSQNKWGGPYIEPFLSGWPIMVNLLPNAGDPGACFVRIMCPGATLNADGTGAWFASGPAMGGQPVSLSGISWGPA